MAGYACVWKARMLPPDLCFNSNYEDDAPLGQLHSTEDMV